MTEKSDIWKTFLVGGIPVILSIIALAFGYGMQQAKIDRLELDVGELRPLLAQVTKLTLQFDNEAKYRASILQDFINQQREILEKTHDPK